MRQKRIRDYLVIFIAGLLWDLILSVDTIFTARFNPLGAAFTTISGTFLGYTTLVRIADYDMMLRKFKVDWIKVTVLAAGSGIGAAGTTWFLSLFYQ